MKRLLGRAITLVPSLAVGACATQMPPESAPAPSLYRALGTEPFWSMTVENERMTYDSADGMRVSVVAPQPRTSFNGHRYETERLTMDVTHKQCSDGMSDRIYADTVMVLVEGRTLHGCGGEIVAPADLAGTNWSITAIDGMAVSGTDYFLNFDADRLNGKAGCNGFSGSYALSGSTLTPGAIITTRMACPGARMEHEAKALDILEGPLQLQHNGDGTLTIRSNGGTMTLRRAV